MWNALNYPAMVIPVTRVSQELDVKQPPHEFLHERDRKNYDWCKPRRCLQSILINNNKNQIIPRFLKMLQLLSSW
jgi:hypothetical protein